MNVKICRSLITSIVMVLAACQTDAAELAAQDKIKILEPLRALHTEQQNVGYSFVMSHRGQIVLRDFAGLSNLAHSIALIPDSRLSIMSITKAFTGLMIVKAISQQKLALDETVGQYLPKGAISNADSITVRMLLAHTSGIPHLSHPTRRQVYVEHFQNATRALKPLKTLQYDAKPGDSYQYSSSGYNVLAAVLETIYEKPIQSVLEEQVTRPLLGIQNTGYLDVMASIDNLGRNYSYVDIWDYTESSKLQLVPTWDFSYNFGGGNMYSTADDLLTLGHAIITSDWVGPEQYDLVTSALEPEVSNWSAGWIVSEGGTLGRSVSITGATPGVQASLYVFPKSEIVFAMIANSWGRESAGGGLVIDAPIEVAERYLDVM